MTDKTELTEHDIGLVKQALAIAVVAVERRCPNFSRSRITMKWMNCLAGSRSLTTS